MTTAATIRRWTADRVQTFTESVIREMTRLANVHGAVNLAQGFPNFPCPDVLKEAAIEAIRGDLNQYAVTWGTKELREALAEKVSRFNKISTDADKNVTVVCGATEGMMATLLAILNTGDEIVIFEPFYENYGPDGVLSGATPRYVKLDLSDSKLSFDKGELSRAFNNRTRAIILNTPHNPTGKVFTRDELSYIAELCQTWNVIAVTDEPYEHMVFEGEHVSLGSLPGMHERTVTINSASKTFSVTGWRVAWCVANPEITIGIRRVHDFLTVGAPHPLQAAIAKAIRTLPASYYDELCAGYRRRRDVLVPLLQKAGFRCAHPSGAYYVMTDFSAISDLDDQAFGRHMVEHGKVAAVPGSSFYANPADGRSQIRFAFPKYEDTLQDGGQKLVEYRKNYGKK